jgi:hypothetical protein
MPIDLLRASDIDEIVAAFAALGWPGKDREQYQRYVAEQDAGDRVILVARQDGAFAGYLTVVWQAGYRPFRDAASRRSRTSTCCRTSAGLGSPRR